MMTVLGCVALKHNVWLVLLSALVCSTGCWAVTGLFARALSTSGAQRLGWQFLTGIAAGSTIWCTHFVAMLAYQAGAPIAFDPIMTIVSAMIAAIGATAGFAAATTAGRWRPALGGALLGLSVAAMHYCGMLAYRVDGLVQWNAWLVALSIAIAVMFAAPALHVAVRRNDPRGRIWATLFLSLAVVGAHFTGMSAFTVVPLRLAGGAADPQTVVALALAITGMSLLIIGTGVVSYTIDDETRAKARAQLRDMALHDALTGLPNRKNFRDRMRREMADARHRGASIMLLKIDLNDFKGINEQYGHDVGDEVLREFSARLAARLDSDEFFARVGGDEFAIVSRISRSRGRDDLPRRLIDALRRPFEIGSDKCVLRASAGMAIYPLDAADDETLINNAGLAMHRAKTERIETVCFYERSMDEAPRARRKLAADLRAAIAKGELEVYFQPQAGVVDRKTMGFEALARWNHPQFGFVPPLEFIAIAEENGFIEALGEWVMRTACSQAATWDPPLLVAVNVSPLQLEHGDLSRLVIEVLETTGLPAHRLELELTESAVVKDPRRSLKVLRKIKKLGVSLALDDFGSGHSSLSTLRQFPFDKIKLDRSFIGEIETSKQARAVVKAVLGLGRGLDIPVLVEGIETEGQLEWLRGEHCDQAQGYLLGRPAPMAHWIDEGLIGVNAARLSPHADAA